VAGFEGDADDPAADQAVGVRGFDFAVVAAVDVLGFRRGRAAHRLVVGVVEVDEVVPFAPELGVELHSQEAAVAEGVDLGSDVDGKGRRRVFDRAEDLDSAEPVADEHFAIRPEVDRRRQAQAVDVARGRSDFGARDRQRPGLEAGRDRDGLRRRDRDQGGCPQSQ
jgi:hypothetical protein